MKNIVFKSEWKEVLDWKEKLVADNAISIDIAGRIVTGAVEEKYNKQYDRPDYVYRFTIDGEIVDEQDVDALYDKLR